MRLGRPSAAGLLTCGFAVIGLLWAGFLGQREIEGVGSVLDRFEYLTADLRFTLLGARSPPPDTVVVAIDDETLRDVGAYPLPRGVVAAIISALAECQPQVIAIDLAFLDAGPPDADAALARALAAAPSVIAAIGQFGPDDSSRKPRPAPLLTLVPQPSRILWATGGLRAATRSGLVNVVTDASGIPRYIPMLYRQGDAVVPSFALAAATGGTDAVLLPDAIRLASGDVAVDFGYHLPIRYYGPAGTMPRISAAHVLRHAFDARDVRAKVVVLGVTASGVGDIFATPFDRIVPGVEVFATGIANLLTGDGLVRTAAVRRIDAGAAIVLAVATVLLMSMRRTVVGLGLASLLLALWGALTLAAFARGYWFSVAVPFAAFAPVAAGYAAARLGVDRYVAVRLAADKATLMRFQSPVLLDHILANPDFLQQPVQQHLAVVFLDLSGFTGVTEELGPTETRMLLAGFQATVEHEVAAHGGYVASFMGDGAMIAFGLPSERPDDATRAMRAIMDLYASLTVWVGSLPAVAPDRLSIRIGGHFGPAVASRLGPIHHQHIAATGDTVNVASRLLEVGKQQKCNVVVSDALFAAAVLPASLAHAPAIRSLDVAIRGRAQPLRIRILA